MKRGVIWIVLTCLIVASLVLASCGTKSTTTTPTSTLTTTPTTTPISKPTTVPTITTTTATTTTTGNWWDKLGKPQYGGTLTIRNVKEITNLDPYYTSNLVTIDGAWLEKLFADDWTVDPAVFGFWGIYRPANFDEGVLAQSYEFTDPSTLIIHVRQGVHWQNIPPANGRELVADDIAFRYNRLYDPATGHFSKSGPFGESATLPYLASVTATDKYTVVLKWNVSNPEFILEAVMLSGTSENGIVCPDAVKLWGDVTDWHHAIGTGPFILKDFIGSSSATLVRNPDYWKYDERYPQNKLPYVDTLKVLIIPDDATALAGLRTGKIDDVDQMSAQQSQDMQKSNPSIVQIKVPASFGLTVDPRNDVKPFNDIRVREAMQKAIDLPTIAKTYYNGTVDPYPVALTSEYMTGWGFPYTQWPQDLKDQYAYDPTAAKKLLADAGYPNGFNTDVVVDNAYDMSLLQIVQGYFAAINVKMDIRVLDYASWQSFVATQNKQDQMAALSTGVMLGKTLEPFIQLTKFLSTGANNWTMIRDPVYDAFYLNALKASSVDQAKQILKDCNEYIARNHYTICLLQPMFYSFVQPWLKGYNGQQNALFGGQGPSLLGFYAARFWIDQNVKKTMGY